MKVPFSNIESITRIAHLRLEDYLEGNLSVLEELDEERLAYNNMDRPLFLEYSSARIQMPII